MGIPISFLGGLWLVPYADVTINMISLFAFIVVLGIVVDDAIVVGENIFNYLEEGMKPIDAAIRGVREMAMPVTFAIITTVAAFAPLLFVAGTMGKIMRQIPIVVIAVLLMSLGRGAAHPAGPPLRRGKDLQPDRRAVLSVRSSGFKSRVQDGASVVHQGAVPQEPRLRPRVAVPDGGGGPGLSCSSACRWSSAASSSSASCRGWTRTT